MSFYSRAPGEGTSKKLLEIEWDPEASRTVIRCDHRGALLDAGTRAKDRLLYVDFTSKECSVIPLPPNCDDQVIPVSNSDALILAVKDRFLLFDPATRKAEEVERRDISFLWSADLFQNRLLFAGRLGSPQVPRLIEHRDRQLVKTIPLKDDHWIFTAFYVDGEAAYVVVDQNDTGTFMRLYDASSRLRSSIPLPDAPGPTYGCNSVTQVGGVRFICAQPAMLAERESDLLRKEFIVRCDGWTLTKVE